MRNISLFWCYYADKKSEYEGGTKGSKIMQGGSFYILYDGKQTILYNKELL